jgi:adenylate cyclase
MAHSPLAYNVPYTGRLLVVDDNKVNRLLLGRGIEQQGHTVAFAENGKQALDILHSQPFDLVLLDIQMPEMDGYQVLERLINDTHLRDIPVIMTTALEELDSVVKCIELGAEDYLTKPVNPVLLRARIGASLEKKRLRDQQRELIRKFAAAEVADDLEESGFALGGKYVDATAMFCDIRGFTSITETQQPEDTIELLNTYYTLMFEAIKGHFGIVNQIMGDGLLAIFGAPNPRVDHSLQAVRAALEMVELIELFNLDQAAQDKPQIRVGVGIASGQMVAGYTGTTQRATYTCVGDRVNLAARLEGHTKVLGQPILIEENTYHNLKGEIPVEPQGLFQAKGKSEAVEVYAVLVKQKVS